MKSIFPDSFQDSTNAPSVVSSGGSLKEKPHDRKVRAEKDAGRQPACLKASDVLDWHERRVGIDVGTVLHDLDRLLHRTPMRQQGRHPPKLPTNLSISARLAPWAPAGVQHNGKPSLRSNCKNTPQSSAFRVPSLIAMNLQSTEFAEEITCQISGTHQHLRPYP